ncbi:PepSY-associated TM helix domain-containing protein [Bradyrhizobium prioriisuperbiae]|uniref:PepSY-associated TM helix domain-containing protein n=1 Tax=Bradyrhizobium prioriisuperbiae TaxID=2854389 RepID=UPI0028E90071|nr:PepSY-associated TM helix domain-containing protein [Bradyrhizobium prioritasuperba]
MKARTVRIWSLVHKWSSLVSTVFLLLLCITGLPLIFHHEIDEALGYSPQPEAVAIGTPKASIDKVATEALATAPGKVIQYVSWDKDEPGSVFVFTNSAPNGEPDNAVVRAFDAYRAKSMAQVGIGPMLIILKLHTDMFAGQPGKLFLGGMGLLMFVAVVSGVVLYWPFTRRLQFSTVRNGKSRRVAWLDWHNLIGVTTVAWVSVVGLTGVINTWAELMLDQWKSTELAAMVAPYAGKPLPAHLASLDHVIDNAKAAAPGMTPAFIAFPGTPFSSSHHFAVFMRGDSTLTARMFKPVLVDGETGAASEVRELPLYLKALLISQPLHFGDYGGMVLKIIWAVLDVLTIIVLGSGLYLWLVKRRKERRGRQLLAAPEIAQAAE